VTDQNAGVGKYQIERHNNGFEKRTTKGMFVFAVGRRASGGSRVLENHDSDCVFDSCISVQGGGVQRSSGYEKPEKIKMSGAILASLRRESKKKRIQTQPKNRQGKPNPALRADLAVHAHERNRLGRWKDKTYRKNER
jgi:hypothetical protein